MPSARDNLTPRTLIFLLVYSPLFFSIFVGIPLFTIGWILGSPVPVWLTTILVVASFFLFGPFCHWMLALCRPWRRFHTWAYRNTPSAQ